MYDSNLDLHVVFFFYPNEEDTLTLTLLSPTKSNKGKWRKCAKSHYVIEAGIIRARNRCPGSDTQVASQGWTVHRGARDPRFVSRGNPHLDPSLSEESLETKNPLWELGLGTKFCDLIKVPTRISAKWLCQSCPKFSHLQLCHNLSEKPNFIEIPGGDA